MKKTVVHFEIGCSDITETSDFYKNVFDWNLIPNGNAAIIDTGNEDALPGHINQLDPDDPQRYITVYIETDTLNDDLQKITDHGGKLLVGPLPLPDGRSFAWFKDIAGNTVGLITAP